MSIFWYAINYGDSSMNIWDKDSRFQPFSCHPDSKNVTGNLLLMLKGSEKK